MINRGKRLHTLCASALLTFSLGLFWSSPAIGAVAQNPLLVTTPVRPNILLILDNSESMQEGIDGRLALGPNVDPDDPASWPAGWAPGEWGDCALTLDMDPDACPAGARNPFSKSSITKRVARNLVNDFSGLTHLGLMAYQQSPPSLNRNDFNQGYTVRWRLAQRALDVRYSDTDEPNWLDPEFDGAFDSDTKRYIDPHPLRDDIWISYNVGVPGYDWDTGADGASGTPQSDRALFWEITDTSGDPNIATLYRDVRESWSQNSVPDNPGFYYHNHLMTGASIFLVDTLRQRGINYWGNRLVFQPANQLEWRSTTSPGLGYLHVPLGGIDGDGSLDLEHRQRLLAKLEPQQHNWDANATTDSDYPLIASGLTPLEGTMRTARDYFIDETGSASFGASQGSGNSGPLPESCGANSIIWLTDGLPSVAPDGSEYGDDPGSAVLSARDAIRDLYERTEDALGNPVQTHIVGFALPPGLDSVLSGAEFDGLDNPLDILAQAGGTPRIRDAQDESELEEVMSDLLAQIVQDAQSSSAAIATNSTRLDTDTLIYQARFDTTDWSGEIRAFSLAADGSFDANNPEWNASLRRGFRPGDGNRDILTWNPDDNSGAFFRWDDTELSDNQMAALDRDRTGFTDNLGEERLAWLRGVQNAHPDFRTRTQTLLGSVVNSDPAIHGRQDFGYAVLPGEEGDDYRDYLQLKQQRAEVLFFGANDGMLHGINAGPRDEGGGEQIISFVPNAVYENLSYLTDPEYNHHFYVDGAPTISDAWDADAEEWRTVLVGTTGAGGGGVFALDITDVGRSNYNPRRQQVLWEFSDDDMHHSTSQPSIVRLENGQWVALFGNGYGEGAHLYVVDLFSGELEEKITLVASGENGLATPAPVSLSGNRRKADTVYAGDMSGNLWRINLNSMRSEFGSGGGPNFSPDPLFQAIGPDGREQPITVRPALTRHPDGGMMVLFGTGAFFRTGDAIVPSGQGARQVYTFYGLRDSGNEINGRGNLAGQRITHEGQLGPFPFDLRVTTQNEATGSGWYLDLLQPSPLPDGTGSHRQTERVVSRAIIRGDRVIFPTMIPDDDPCGFGGDSWLMEMNAFSGSRLDVTPFDLDGDGNFDEGDYVEIEGPDGETIRVPVSGKRSEVGVISTPGVVSAGETEYKYTSGSAGEIERHVESGSSDRGRQSWQQLR